MVKIDIYLTRQYKHMLLNTPLKRFNIAFITGILNSKLGTIKTQLFLLKKWVTCGFCCNLSKVRASGRQLRYVAYYVT